MPSVLILLEGKDKQLCQRDVDEAMGIGHHQDHIPLSASTALMTALCREETPFLSQHLQP